ncbi:MAG: TfoX/Sxy family DNA transformation protein [Bdellovibrio sp.]|nr:TfoX/Sxy family DNA transformation protein [Bdellovibrio sp.]
MAKEPGELKWIEDLLPEDGYRRKAMFGGFSYYIEEKMILLMFETDDKRWNGVMFPVDVEFHPQALAKFSELQEHSILRKWLFLPLETEGFEELVPEILREVLRPNSIWGTIPKGKGKKSADDSPKAKKKKDKELEGISVRMDTRTPRMFSDEPAQDALAKAVKITDLKNLGEVTERQFASVGIKTATQFIKLGWQKTMLKLVAKDPKYRHSMYAYALIGALTNTEFSRITDAQKEEARNFVHAIPRPNKNKSQSKMVSKDTKKVPKALKEKNSTKKKKSAKKPVVKKKK